jgi:predicted amidohydrolase
MSKTFRVACVQTNSARDWAANEAMVSALVRRARADGADLIVLPENVGMIEPKTALQLAKAEPEETHPTLAACRNLARETGAWILLGSIAAKLSADRLANRSLLLDDTGSVVARYDKIHLFDVDLGSGESYRESATMAPGDQAVVAATPWGNLGLTVCYDVRFPQLYRHLAKASAHFLAIPAAFTRTTGRAHWHVLQRARAIETGCFVFAAAQCGDHAEGRQTFGHSLIVDPWGVVLADGGEEVGVIVADIDVSQVDQARIRIPALSHDRPFT